MKNNQFLALSHQYQINKTHSLGKGSTGEVYLGKSTTSNEPVAIKIIRLETIDNEVTQYLLKMEKTALQTVVHDNVLRGLKIIENSSKCYIITEYCNGGTLKELIKKETVLSEAKSLEIIKGILRGYCSLVRNKITHRDLKPANIMFHNNIPKIIDFGYCEIQGYSKPSLEYNVGSPSYMAPESFECNIYNEKTEIWAIGVILYECLMGKTFDDGKHMSEVFKTIKKYGIPFGKEVSDKCRKIITWCLEFKPEKRPSTLELLQHLSENKNTGNEPEFFILEKGRTKINSLFFNSNGFESTELKRKVEQKNLPVETRKLGKKISIKCQDKIAFDEIKTKESSSNSKSKQDFGIMTKRAGLTKKVENIQHQLTRPTANQNKMIQNEYGLTNEPVFKTEKYFTGQNVHNKLHFHHVSAFNSVLASPRDTEKQESKWINPVQKEEKNSESQKQKTIIKSSGYSSPLQQGYNEKLSASIYRPLICHQENPIQNENVKFISKRQMPTLRNSSELYQQRQNFRDDNCSYSVYESIPVYLNKERPSSSIYQLNQYLNEKERPISIFNSVPQRTFR